MALLLSLAAPLAAAQNTGQSAPPAMPRTASPAGAEVYIQAPADGAEVRSPFVVRFGLRGMGVAPATITTANTGHHHLLIDVETLPPDDLPLPQSDQVRHFGAGQTETELSLPPGRHTLQLVLGDALHIPHNPPVRSAKITITVVE
jgi:Domain of unknown function (DUF4399)